MKTSKEFKKVIQKHLENKCLADPQFKLRYELEEKNIDDCIKFILNTVKDSGVSGFTDDEIFGMAVHYYDEDNVDVGGDINMKIVVNHTIQLTDEEIEQAKKDAKERIYREQLNKMSKPKTKVKKQEVKTGEQTSLF